MRFSQGVIELERTLRGRFGWRIGLLWRRRSVTGEKLVGIRESGIRKRVFWILLDRLVEVTDRFAQVRPGPLVPKISAPQVKLMRGIVVGRPRGNRPRLSTREFDAQSLGVRLRDLAFDRENVGQLPIVDIAPKMRIGQGVD